MVMIRMIAKHPARADGSYEGPSGVWKVGMSADVVPEEAERLLADFGSCFTANLPKGGAPAAKKSKIAEILEDPGAFTTRVVRAHLTMGRFDNCLPDLLEAEKNGQARISIQKGVIHRSHRVGVKVDESPWR